MKLPGPWPERLDRRVLKRLGLGLAVGAAGGWVADLLHVPLAWMLGALFFTMFAALMRLPVEVPLWLRAWFMIPVGLFLGESFDGLTLERLASWPLSIAGAFLYVPVAASAAYLYYRHVAREPRVTAVCSSMPGGLTAMVIIASAMGADDRRVALAQVFRIAIVICLAPAIAFGMLGLEPPDAVEMAARARIGWADFAWLFAAAVAATALLDRIGVPIPFLLGPLAVSAVLRMGGFIDGALPSWLVEWALVVTGSSIGTRFRGVEWREWLRFAGLTFGGTAVLMAVSALFAVGVAAVSTVDVSAALLAFAPGGVAEMSLIALAVDADPGYVAVMHVARIGFILMLMPLLGWGLRRYAYADATGAGGAGR